MPSLPSDEENDTDFPNPHAPNTPWMRGRWMFAIMVGMAISGTALVAVRGSTMTKIRAERRHIDSISQLDAQDPCADKPQIKLGKNPTQDNLGKLKIPSEAEGLVIPSEVFPGGQQVQVLINAIENGDQMHKSYGHWGKYYGLAAAAGKSFKVEFSIVDSANKPVIIPEIDITFFDLDKHGDNEGIEFIKLKPDAYVTTKDPFIDITKEDDGYIKFTANSSGDSKDNPQDPLLLTVQQKKKAVTVKYNGKSKFDVQMGSSAGGGTRGYIFVFRPSLTCAKTTDGEVATEEETNSELTTTPEPDSTTDEEKKQNCLFVVPVVNWCIPKFW